MGETPTNVANLNMAQGLKIRVEDGCDLADPCDSNICPENSHCHDDWITHTCVCNPGNTHTCIQKQTHSSVRLDSGVIVPSLCPVGYFGKDCMDACQLNPCEHVSTCVRKPSSSHGYICECGQDYYGQYCENK